MTELKSLIKESQEKINNIHTKLAELEFDMDVLYTTIAEIASCPKCGTVLNRKGDFNDPLAK